MGARHTLAGIAAANAVAVLVGWSTDPTTTQRGKRERTQKLSWLVQRQKETGEGEE